MAFGWKVGNNLQAIPGVLWEYEQNTPSIIVRQDFTHAIFSKIV